MTGVSVTARQRREGRTGLVAVVGVVLAALAAIAIGQSGADAEPGTQYPFACTAQDHGLELLVDNQDGEGVEVLDDAGETLGWSRDCDAETRTWYYAVDTDGEHHLIRDDGDAPIDGGLEAISALLGDDREVATTTLTDGTDAPYLIRHERGVINRFIYSISMLATVEEVSAGGPDGPDLSLWNGRLLYQFQGGVGIGHTQGRFDDRGITGDPDRLARGYAVAYSTANRTGEHYNLLLAGRTAEQVKARFVEGYGEPDYTVGLGGSGGGIQQYVFAQNHPDLLDAAIPQRSYPDMTTQTIHVGDCALLDRWMDLEAEDLEFWADWDNRKLLQGMNSIDGYLGSTAQGLNGARSLLAGQFGIELPQQTGSSECLEGWLGLLPLAMNPLYGSERNWDLLGDQVDAIERTHWSDAREVYGTDPDTGFARVPWDNVGVQYGLRALVDGEITAEQFLSVNAEVGSWVDPQDMVPEGVPFEDPEVVLARIAAERGLSLEEVVGGLASGLIPATELFDPWSSRNAAISPDGGTTPAPRSSGDLAAIEAAYASGLVFRGELERQIPIVDVRDYLEQVLDMHNVHQSFAARQRLLDGQGDHDNQLIWFIEADADGNAPAADEVIHAAFDLIAEWLGNLEDDPTLSLTEAAPEAAQDTCFALDGGVIASGDGVWAGILDDGPDGDCTQAFEPFTTSRIEAGGPITGDIYKCNLMPVATAVAEGLYGDWQPTAAQLAQLEAIHPDGVCDYGLPGVGEPDVEVAPAPTAVQVEGGLRITGAEPNARVQLRQDGRVVATVTALADGETAVQGPRGTYVVAQIGADGQRGLLSEPVLGGGRTFSDVPVDHPFHTEIEAMVAAGLTTGFPDGTFRPTIDVTRQAMAAFLYRAAGEPEGPFPDPGFPDVGESHPFGEEIAWLVEEGIATGYGDGTFRPTASVTRQAAAAFLYRAADEPGGPFADPEFEDVGAEHPFRTEISWLVEQGIAEGFDDGTFRPDRSVTRQAAAAFLTR